MGSRSAIFCFHREAAAFDVGSGISLASPGSIEMRQVPFGATFWAIAILYSFHEVKIFMGQGVAKPTFPNFSVNSILNCLCAWAI